MAKIGPVTAASPPLPAVPGTPPVARAAPRHSTLSSLKKPLPLYKQIFLWIASKLLLLFRKIRRLFAPKMSRPSIVPAHLPTPEHRTFWRLQKKKWCEGIDGCYQKYGPHVFDRGLHGHAVEPGFIESWERGALFIHDHLGERTTPEMYLQLHRTVCRHFCAGANGTLTDQSGVGVFRRKENEVRADYKGVYQLKRAVIDEFVAAGMGTIIALEKAGDMRMNYRPMDAQEIHQIFSSHLNAFYQEIDAAQNPEQKLLAIARLHQRLEWLHPVHDGTGRTDTLLLNKHLTEHGFHPVILEYPHLSSSLPLPEWTQKLREGLNAWQRCAQQIEAKK